MQYYVAIAGQQYGPFERERLLQMQLPADAHVWRAGLPVWMRREELPELQGSERQAERVPNSVPECHVSLPSIQNTASLTVASTGSMPNFQGSLSPGLLLAIGGVAGTFLLFAFCCIGALSVASAPSPEEQLRAEVSTILNARKQEVFYTYHPIGTAKSIDVHEVYPAQGAAGETLLGFRYTIRWEGPVVKEGATKIESFYDPEVGTVTATRILSTNGITNPEAEAAAFQLGVMIGAALRGR
jgi:hypothetical protein